MNNPQDSNSNQASGPEPSLVFSLPHVSKLAPGETVIQIAPLGQASLAALTSTGRILVPGPTVGSWREMPLPSQEEA